ncbi:MAG TPA: group I intron-associated PD-(D/E)XK endonuclease, partial [Candidatus Sulfotelmatobacter sp.]
GESAPYDFAIDHRGRFLRVQVKCTIYCRGNSYKCHLDTNGVSYDPRDLDFFAAYVIPSDTWYLLPIRATNRQPDILLTPHNPNSKYSRYHEAWHLLMKG